MSEPSPGRVRAAPPPTLTEAVRSIFLERRSGVIEVAPDGPAADVRDGARRRLFFVDGELYLPQQGLARRLAERLPVAGGTGTFRGEVRELMLRIGRLLAAWRGSEFTFFEGRQVLPPDLVGPLPTAFLLMEWAVAGRGGAEMLAELGGPAAELSAARGGVPPAIAAVLDPAEAVLLARLARPLAVGELLRQTADEEAAVLRRLCRLLAVGLVRPQRAAVAVRPGVLVASDLLERLAERVERELETRPLGLEPADHRARLAELLARSGGLTHYELLEVKGDASGDEVYEAYDRLARLVHPAHAEPLKLGGREAALWLLFERATDGYLTLSSPDRRQRYDVEIGLTRDPSPPVEVRAQEGQTLARGHYQRAAEMIEAGEYHFAVELMQQAVRSDPRPEYFRLLGDALVENPNWQRRAAEAYRQAIERGGDEAHVRNALGRLCENEERWEEARRHFDRALEHQPADPESLAGLSRLEGKAESRPARRGLFWFLRRRK